MTTACPQPDDPPAQSGRPIAVALWLPRAALENHRSCSPSRMAATKGFRGEDSEFSRKCFLRVLNPEPLQSVGVLVTTFPMLEVPRTKRPMNRHPPGVGSSWVPGRTKRAHRPSDLWAPTFRVTESSGLRRRLRRDYFPPTAERISSVSRLLFHTAQKTRRAATTAMATPTTGLVGAAPGWAFGLMPITL